MDIKPHDNEKGFTLVELLVALALAGIVSTAIYASFNSQERVYKAQQLIVEMQQNIKSAMLIATKEVRMANAYLGKEKGLEWKDDSGLGQNILGFQAHNDFEEGRDAIDIVNADFTLKTYIEKDMPIPSSELDVVSVVDQETGAVFQEGMFAIITNGVHSDLMEITTVQGAKNPSAAQKLQRNSSAPSGLNNQQGLINDYLIGDIVLAAKLVSFRIMEPASEHPYIGISLNYNPNDAPADRNYTRLVDDIEDLQIVYIFQDGDEANEPDDTDADTTNNYENVSAIRLSIVARTREPVRGFSGSAPIDLEDHDVTNTQDGYHRRVLTEEIVVRNFHL